MLDTLLAVLSNAANTEFVGLYGGRFWQTPHKLAPPTSERWGRVYDPSELYVVYQRVVFLVCRGPTAVVAAESIVGVSFGS